MGEGTLASMLVGNTEISLHWILANDYDNLEFLTCYFLIVYLGSPRENAGVQSRPALVEDA